MSAKNRFYLIFREYGKPQLYGRAWKSVQADAASCPQEAGLASSTSTKTE